MIKIPKSLFRLINELKLHKINFINVDEEHVGLSYEDYHVLYDTAYDTECIFDNEDQLMCNFWYEDEDGNETIMFNKKDATEVYKLHKDNINPTVDHKVIDDVLYVKVPSKKLIKLFKVFDTEHKEKFFYVADNKTKELKDFYIPVSDKFTVKAYLK